MPPVGVKIHQNKLGCRLQAKPHGAEYNPEHSKRIIQCGYYWREQGLSQDCVSINRYNCESNNKRLADFRGKDHLPGWNPRRAYGVGCPEFSEMVSYFRYITMDDINIVKPEHHASLGTLCSLQFPRPTIKSMKGFGIDGCWVRNANVKVTVHKIT